MWVMFLGGPAHGKVMDIGDPNRTAVAWENDDHSPGQPVYHTYLLHRIATPDGWVQDVCVHDSLRLTATLNHVPRQVLIQAIMQPWRAQHAAQAQAVPHAPA